MSRVPSMCSSAWTSAGHRGRSRRRSRASLRLATPTPPVQGGPERDAPDGRKPDPLAAMVHGCRRRCSGWARPKRPLPHGVNPFRPGAGVRPPFLAGREGELEITERKLTELASGRSLPRGALLYGPRGNGKTALLLEIGDRARKRRLRVERLPVDALTDREYLVRELQERSGRIRDQVTGIQFAGVGAATAAGGGNPERRSVLRRVAEHRRIQTAGRTPGRGAGPGSGGGPPVPGRDPGRQGRSRRPAVPDRRGRDSRRILEAARGARSLRPVLQRYPGAASDHGQESW